MKVSIVGAYGETGGSIVQGLLESPNKFEITALVRPLAVDKPQVKALQAKGLRIGTIDLDASPEEIARSIGDAEVLISCLLPWPNTAELALVRGAKLAGVKRYVPSAWASVAPPVGVVIIRELKEEVINEVKRLRLPYTVIDVGWWYQNELPRLPSGKIDYAVAYPTRISGDGNMPTAAIHQRDVGRYTARIIADPRTLNKYVFAYDDVITQNAIYDTLEQLSGETIERQYTTKEEYVERIAAGQKLHDSGARDFFSLANMLQAQYYYSLWIRGDNTPENAEYLGYLLTKDLYPDMQHATLKGYIQEVLDGKATRIYEGRAHMDVFTEKKSE